MRSSQIQDAGTIAKLVPVGAGYNVFQALHPLGSAPSTAAILGVPGTGRLPRRVFSVIASGLVKTAADSDFQIALFAGTDTNTANDTMIGQTGALPIAAAGAGGNFWTRADMIFSTETGLVQGQIAHMVNGTYLAPSAFSLPLGVNDANEPVFSMVFAALLATPNAASYVLLDTFAIEA